MKIVQFFLLKSMFVLGGLFILHSVSYAVVSSVSAMYSTLLQEESATLVLNVAADADLQSQLAQLSTEQKGVSNLVLTGLLTEKDWTVLGEFVETQQISVIDLSGIQNTSIAPHVFESNSFLKQVKLSSILTNIGEAAFRACDELKNVDLSVCHSLKVVGADAFGLGGLTSVVLPNSVEKVSKGAFYGCKELATVTLSDSLKTIGDFAFSACKKLTQITLPKSLIQISAAAFANCDLLGLVIYEATTPSLLHFSPSVFTGIYDKAVLELPQVPESQTSAWKKWGDFKWKKIKGKK